MTAPLLPSIEQVRASRPALAEGLVRFSRSLLSAPFRAVGPREIERVLDEIVIDSLAPVYCGLLGEKDAAFRIVDLGCGPGIPIIPLAMALPNADLLGLDSSVKRLAYARETSAEMGLHRVLFACHRLASRPGHGDPGRAVLQSEFKGAFQSSGCFVTRGMSKLPETIAIARGMMTQRSKLIVYSTPRSLEQELPKDSLDGFMLQEIRYRRTNAENEYSLAVLTLR